MVSRGIACVDCSMECERSHGKQGGFLRIVDRFFKIMFGKDRSKFMYLPPESVKIAKHLTNQETQIEDSSGHRWSVTLSLVNGSLAFQRGWEKFFLDHGLKVGELLVFQYIRGSHFTVQIYGTSARERTNFNNEMPCQSKKRRRYQGTASEDEAYQTDDINSRDISISASEDQSQNRKTKLAVENADLGVSELLPISVDFEDPICMIVNRSVEEHRTSLYDLSIEMENKTSYANKCEGAVITMLDPHTETEQFDVNLDNASDTKFSLSCNRVLEPTNPARHDAMEQTKATAEDAQITSNTGDISIDKFVTALDAKTALSRNETSDEMRKKVDDTQVAPHSRDAFMKRFYHEKPSDNSKMKKSMLNVQDGKPKPLSASPSIGGRKIAEREHAVKIKFGEFSISSSTVKNPLGPHAIKKEVEMEDKSNVFHQASSSGKEPSLVWNKPQTVSPLVIKVEPDLPYETGQLDAINPFSICSFSAKVESLLYLELPVQIILARGRRLRAQTIRAQTIVYLRDSVRRLWPVVYHEYVGGRALIGNWSGFCEQNNIKQGDICRFQVENGIAPFVFRVDVARGSG